MPKHPNPRMIAIPILLLLATGGLVYWFTRPALFFYAGTVEATEVTLSSRVTSVIAAYLVREGETVEAGKTVVTLSGEDLRLAADLAQKEYVRGEQLYRQGSMTQAVFEQLKFKRDQTALMVDWCTIKAPLGGTILSVHHEPGEMAAPGMSLLTLGNLSDVWAFVYVEQPMLARLSLGQEVSGTLPEMPGRTFPGRIALIRDEAEFTPKNVQTRSERTRLVYGVKIVFPNPDKVLKPGMTVEVKLPEK